MLFLASGRWNRTCAKFDMKKGNLILKDPWTKQCLTKFKYNRNPVVNVGKVFKFKMFASLEVVNGSCGARGGLQASFNWCLRPPHRTNSILVYCVQMGFSETNVLKELYVIVTVYLNVFIYYMHEVNSKL